MSSSYFLGVWTVAAVLIVLAVPPWGTIGMNLLDLFKRTVGGWREDGSPSAKFGVRQLRLPPLSVRGAMSSVMELARKRARQISWALAILTYASLLHHFGTIEHEQYNPSFFAFTISVTLCVALILTFMTRRALFSAVLTALMVVFIEVVARVKFEFMQFGLHSYDLIFLTSIGTVDFLWHDYRRYVLLFFGGLVLSAVLGWVCWRYDRSQVARTLSLLALLTAGGAVWIAVERNGKPRSFLLFGQAPKRHVALFYSSWSDTYAALSRGQMGLIEAAAASSAPPFNQRVDCQPSPDRPTIVVVHEESVVPLSLFPTLDYDKRLDSFFKSDDGRVYGMRVETFGGSSWLTEFSILTGLSTFDFPSMRHFVQLLMQGKLKGTMTQQLERCGYRNMLFYPAFKNFVVNAKFYDSIGLREVYDRKDQGATDYYMRDRFWFTNAVAEMGRHFSSSSQPLFIFIQTMSPHGPHTWKFAPELDVPAGGPGTAPDVSEYLRRVWIAKLDYEYLISELKSKFPNQKFLVVHYGDHHPLTTRPLIGLVDQIGALGSLEFLNYVLDTVLSPDSVGMRTYYAAIGLNYTVPPMPDLDIIDTVYLGQIVLKLAGLPLSEAQQERERFMMLCKGRYFSCPERHQILEFHRRLINSGLLIQ